MGISVKSIAPDGINWARPRTDTTEQHVTEFERVGQAGQAVDRNKLILLPDLQIIHVDIDTERPMEFVIGTEQPSIELSFSLSSSLVHTFDMSSAAVQLNVNQHWIIYYPKTLFRTQWDKGRNRELISFFISPEFVERYIPREKLFGSFIDNLNSEKIMVLCNAILPITPQMNMLLREILDNRHSQGFKRMYIESKVIELFMLQLEQIHAHHNIRQDHYYRDNGKMYRKMQDAQYIINNSLEKPYSLQELAQLIGTNEYHLKKGFKQIFGTTVYGYITEMRMNEAKKLLLSNELNVNEVAQMLGYNDSTNFSAAFKKHFGYTPGKIRHRE